MLALELTALSAPQRRRRQAPASGSQRGSAGARSFEVRVVAAAIGGASRFFVRARLLSVLVHRPTSLCVLEVGILVPTIELAAPRAGSGAKIDVMSVGTTHLSHGPLISRGSTRADDIVLRRHRRSGVGAAAATLLWRRLPGAWVVRVAEANQAALTFWRRIVTRFTGGAFAEAERTGVPHAWRVLTFESPSLRSLGPQVG